jgi:hypothetical protein
MKQTISSAYGPGISRATFLFTLILGVAGIILVVLFTPAGAHAGAFPQDKLPGILKPWCDWVLHEEKSHTCPLVWNQAEERECVWPSSLRLDATASGATFTFSGYLDTQAWIVLPGSTRYWPQGVTSSGQDAVVLRHHQRPAVLLEPGPFHLEGKLVWEHLPDALPLPPDVALVNLRLENAKVPNPRVSRGNLQLRHSSHSEAETRIDPKSIASIPALGWDFNPDAIRTELNLPPGWRYAGSVPLRMYLPGDEIRVFCKQQHKTFSTGKYHCARGYICQRSGACSVSRQCRCPYG